MRIFKSGATRDSDDSKLDFEGFFSPDVMIRRAHYMNKHRVQADGKLRDSDNWQKGIPVFAYMKSLLRHCIDLWRLHRLLLRGSAITTEFIDVNMASEDELDELEELLCAVAFNVDGYLHEVLRAREL